MGRSKLQTNQTSFAADTAKKIRKTERCVQEAVRRANNISQEIRDSIRDVESIADNSLELDALASLEESEQKAAVQSVLDGKARSIRDVVRQKGEATNLHVTTPNQPSEEQYDATDTSTPSGTVDLKRLAKDASGDVLAQKERIRTLNKECTALKAHIKELEARVSDLMSPPAALINEMTDWRDLAMEREARCIDLEQRVCEMETDAISRENRGVALRSMLDDLETTLNTNPGDFQMDTLDLFENRFSDLVFLIKNIKRR